MPLYQPSSVSEILDIPTSETDDSLVLAPDGTGGTEWRAETGGGGGGATLYHDTTTRTVTNTTTETTVFPNQSITGGTLGNTGSIRVTLIINLDHSVAGTCTVRVKFGSTAIATLALDAGAVAAVKPLVLRATIMNLGAQNSQRYEVDVLGLDGTTPYIRFALGTAAADTSTTDNFSITAQWGAASTSLTYTQYSALVELLV